VNARARAILAIACGAHVLHDGFSDILYVVLPVWAAELGLTFAQVGTIRTTYTGAMALCQMPASLCAERWGERRFLALGTALCAAGFVAVGWVGGFASLLVVLAIAGAGSGAQHPLSSSLVSRAYESGPRRAALGTYNFAGDLGKIAGSASMALAVAAIGWRSSTAVAGGIGLIAAAAIVLLLTVLREGGPAPVVERDVEHGSGWGIRDLRGFQALAAVGMIDNATRTGFLTFLPFALMTKGVGVTGIGLALALVFAGGAIGKFVCGFIAERVGVIRTVVLTEAATAAGILAIVAAPSTGALAVLFPLGIALNGTSSVLYATVADLVTPDRRSRAYGLYYTLAIGASSAAPSLYGVASDTLGVPATLTIVGLAVLITIPLCLVLRAAVAAPAEV
jgi:MFS transporter, FSR family, fosmidomycin resistance protein